MDLNKELSDLKSSFKEGGVLTKIFLVLGFFFGVSSITSLASEVVGWRGFILDGVNFYKEHYAENLISLANLIGFSYTENEIHTATVTSIAVCVGMRTLAMGQKVAFQVINEKYNGNQKPNLKQFAFIAIFFTVGVWLWYGIFNPPIYPWLVILVVVLYPLIIVSTKLYLAKKDTEYFEKGKYSYVKSYYSYMLAILIVIGALAAVNSGLTEKPNKNSQQDAANDAAPLL